MIDFNKARLIFLILFTITLALFLLDVTGPIPFIVVDLIYIIILFGFSFFIRSGFYVKAISFVDNSEGKIAITFDDGPVAAVTSSVLDLLKKFDAKATFFCIGKNIPGNEELLKRIIAEGHQIGNHTYSHSPWYGFYSHKTIIKELEMTSDQIFKVTGQKTEIFRPPFGVTNPEVRKAVKALNLKVIGWSKRTFDGSSRNKKKIFENAIKGLKQGDIVLFHDNHPQIVEVLEQFLKYIAEHKLKSVRLNELMPNS